MATWPTITDDDGSGTTGTILDQAKFNEIRDYIGGAWVTPTYSAGNFTGSGSMSWNVDSAEVFTYAYVIIGKTMILSWYLGTTDTTGTASNELRIAIPGGYTAQATTRTIFWYIDAGGTATAGMAEAGFGSTFVSLQKFTAANWTLTSSDNTHVAGQITIQIA